MEMEDIKSIARKNPLEMTSDEIFSIYFTTYLKDHNDENRAKVAAQLLTEKFISARNRRKERPKEYRAAKETLIEEIRRATDDPTEYLPLH